jgi:hypothetical protein
MANLTVALRQIKNELADLLSEPFVHRVAKEVGHTWRERLLDPVTTLHLMILQVLFGNTSYAHLPRLAALKCTASALCQAKLRLPVALLETLIERLWEQVGKAAGGDGRWKGHRTFIVDGSSASMPDTPDLQKHYGQPGAQKKGCGFPVVKLLTLFDAATGMVRKVLSGPYATGELSRMPLLHPLLEAGDLLLGDRAFCSFVHLALLGLRQVHGLIRMHQKQVVSFKVRRPHATGKKSKGLPRSRWIKRLGHQDQLVEHFKPKQRPAWYSQKEYDALPEKVLVRELRYRITQRGWRSREVTLVTTLLDPVLYPKAELAQLYLSRWRVENNFRDLKQTLGMAVLKGQSPEMIQRELLAFCLVYNLVRLVMHEAGRRQKVPVDRISFIDAARWLAHATPGDPLPRLVVNPLRPNRLEPRVIKRRHNGYSVMTRPRDELRHMLKRGVAIGCR